MRPNVIVVLDTSGSMTETGRTRTTRHRQSGDHPRSKLYQAKQVLRQIVQDNQDKVSFQIGTYTQYGMGLPDRAVGRTASSTVSGRRALHDHRGHGARRPRGRLGDGGTSNRGLQSWQIIYAQWGSLTFDEDANGSGRWTRRCRASLTGLPEVLPEGSTLATELAAAMNAATCTSGSRVNTYTVAYDTATGVFTFSRTGTRTFRIQWGAANSIRNALAETGTTGATGWATSIPTDAPYTLLYRTTGTGTADSLAAPFSDGMDTQWSFTEAIGGTNVKFYQVATSRLWNGEMIRVNTSGEVCGMDFAPAPAPATSAPVVTLQSADASCNPGTDVAIFAFAGAREDGNDSPATASGRSPSSSRAICSRPRLRPSSSRSAPTSTSRSRSTAPARRRLERRRLRGLRGEARTEAGKAAG